MQFPARYSAAALLQAVQVATPAAEVADIQGAGEFAGLADESTFPRLSASCTLPMPNGAGMPVRKEPSSRLGSSQTSTAMRRAFRLKQLFNLCRKRTRFGF